LIFFFSSRIESSEDERSPATATRYDQEDEDDDEVAERSDYYQSSQRKRVEVSLEMPLLPVPYSDNNKVGHRNKTPNTEQQYINLTI
jgi:hypothetical protein